MPFDVVAIASSLGAIRPLGQILTGVPKSFPAAILLLQHMSHKPSYFVQILRQFTGLPIRWAQDGERLEPGSVLVVPPDQHLVVAHEGTLALSDAPRIKFVRPSADLLFESVAAVYRERSIAVVLPGRGKDGALGVRAIKNAGGRVLVQDKTRAASFDMPLAAMQTGAVDFVLPVEAIAPALVSLVTVEGAASLFRVSPAFSLEQAQRYRVIG